MDQLQKNAPVSRAASAQMMGLNKPKMSQRVILDHALASLILALEQG
jgi:hypothetical protein